MDLTPLDNPAWYALNSYHRHLATWGNVAVRYQPGTLIAAAMPENDRDGFNDLESLVAMDELVAVLGEIPSDLVSWEIVESNFVPQMICMDLKPAPRVDTIRLTVDDVPDMLGLIDLAQPGPFLPRTIEMGQYFGLRQDGQLVAMAGERLHMIGFCEVSAVCTHPNYRGRGYGGAMTTIVAEGMIARGEIPFLHVAPTNVVAQKLYRKLGFRIRTELQLSILKRTA